MPSELLPPANNTEEKPQPRNALGFDFSCRPTPPIRAQTQFSQGFGDWLIRHRVGLVCSTYQTGQLVFVGARESGQPVLSGAGFSRAMGGVVKVPAAPLRAVGMPRRDRGVQSARLRGHQNGNLAAGEYPGIQ